MLRGVSRGPAGTFDPTSLTITGAGGAGFIDLPDQDPIPPQPAAGVVRIFGETTAGFTRLIQSDAGVTNVVLARDTVILAQNITGTTITKGQAVRIRAPDVEVPLIVLANNGSEGTMPCAGLAMEDIPDSTVGQIMELGILSGIDMSAFGINQILYVDSTDGLLTNVRPIGTTAFVQCVGLVMDADSVNGKLLVGCGSPTLLNRETGTNELFWEGQIVRALSTFDGPIGQFSAQLGGFTNLNADLMLNTRIRQRVSTFNAPAAAPTYNTDTDDETHFTGITTNITSMTTGLNGTPVDGDILVVEFTDNGTARTIAWGTSFESSTVTLPATTVASAKLTVTLKWNIATSKWRCVGVA